MSAPTTSPDIPGAIPELSLLYRISRILDRSLDLADVAVPVLESMSNHTGMLHGTFLLLNRQSGEIQIEAAHGLSEAQQKRGHYRPGEGVVGKVVSTGKAVVVPRISDEPMFLDRTGVRKEIIKKDEVSFICVPIKIENECIGALSADRLFSEEKTLDEDVRLLTIIASMIAQAARIRMTLNEERNRLLAENERLQVELREQYRPTNIIGRSQAMLTVYEAISQVAPSISTVLIRGDSGVGKELVAHAIHHASPRSGMPYIKVNCAALPETILEDELFGHERGAFTGATDKRKGRFELAAGGTLFLDEIGDFSPATQVKLLRVLQEREFERIGGSQTIPADVRIIAATNRNLEELMEQELFRQDLYYRLNVFPILIPALRSRKSDVLLLADHFVAKYAAQNHKTITRISTPAIDMLTAYHWPGNVRELENCIERAVLVSNDGVIRGHHLPPTLQMAQAVPSNAKGTLQERVDSYEKELVIEALKRSKGNRAQAARDLEISERIMGLRVDKYSIDAVRYK